MAAFEPVRLGIDLGGSKILGAVVRGSEVVAREKRATKADEGYRSVLKRIARTVEELCDHAGLKPGQLPSLGLGVPGPVAQNRLLQAPNLGWKDPNLAADLAELTGIPKVHLANDVNCGALGEATVGVGRGCRSVFALFVGTGLGGGWVFDGRVHEGAHGFAGEVGHIRVPGQDALCGCGQRGCLETLASKRGIARLLREAVAAGKPCRVQNLDKFKSRELEEAFRAGCTTTVAAVHTAAESLGWAITALSAALDPQLFVLGGGIGERLGPELLMGIEAAREASPFVADHTRYEVKVGELGGEAVAVGAAQLGAPS